MYFCVHKQDGELLLKLARNTNYNIKNQVPNNKKKNK